MQLGVYPVMLRLLMFKVTALLGPGTNDFSLEALGDADIGAVHDLLSHETGAGGNGSAKDDHDGVSRRITQPVLGERSGADRTGRTALDRVRNTVKRET